MSPRITRYLFFSHSDKTKVGDDTPATFSSLVYLYTLCLLCVQHSLQVAAHISNSVLSSVGIVHETHLWRTLIFKKLQSWHMTLGNPGKVFILAIFKPFFPKDSVEDLLSRLLLNIVKWHHDVYNDATGSSCESIEAEDHSVS